MVAVLMLVISHCNLWINDFAKNIYHTHLTHNIIHFLSPLPQIGSLSVTVSHGGSLQLLVSQPGGTYIPLCYTSEGGSGSPHPNTKRK